MEFLVAVIFVGIVFFVFVVGTKSDKPKKQVNKGAEEPKKTITNKT